MKPRNRSASLDDHRYNRDWDESTMDGMSRIMTPASREKVDFSQKKQKHQKTSRQEESLEKKNKT